MKNHPERHEVSNRWASLDDDIKRKVPGAFAEKHYSKWFGASTSQKIQA
jgi:hypothetical protein